jgi:cell wall-associated NlpC family hydrolase
LFIAAALVEVGVFTSMPKFEYYPKDWFLHTDNQILLESVKYHTENLLSSNCEFVELPLDTPLMRGDMILFTTRNPEIPNHSGVYWDDQEQFIHCTPWKGVSMRHLQSGYFESRVHNIFRVEEV